MYDWWFRFDVLLAVQRLGLGVVLCVFSFKDLWFSIGP